MAFSFGGIQHAVVTGLATGDNTIVAAGSSGQQIVLTHFQFAITGTGTLTFKSDVGGGAVALSGAMPVAAPGLGAANNDKGHVVTAAGKALNINLGAGITACEGYISYFYA